MTSTSQCDVMLYSMIFNHWQIAFSFSYSSLKYMKHRDKFYSPSSFSYSPSQFMGIVWTGTLFMMIMWVSWGNQDVRSSSPWTNLWWNDFWGMPIDSHHSHKSYRPLTVLTFGYDFLIYITILQELLFFLFLYILVFFIFPSSSL